MPCRDYEYEYQAWLQRGREHLDKMTEMLRQMCQAAKDQAMELPPSVAEWCAKAKDGKEVSLTKEVFDATARMLCQMCQAAEEKSLALPPAVAAWWTEHKARDEQREDLAKGLPLPPGEAGFWEMHASRERVQAEVAGINYADAVRALEKAGFRVLRQSKTVVMADASRKLLIPKTNPVNPFAMATIIARAGLTEQEFRKLL